MNEMKKQRVVIAGGGTAGWMTAAALAKTFGPTIDVTLVESDAIGTIGVGEATIPPIVTYNRLLEIDEAEFMAATQATFKLGINFEGWKGEDDAYFHSFGTTGKDHWSCGFQHFWRRAAEQGDIPPYAEYCPETVAALAGKFAHTPKKAVNYAFHLDAGLYAKFLRALAEKNGAVRREGKIAKVNLDAENGHIASLDLEGGETIEGDLFVDCTGFRALLIGEALGIGFDDWTHYLPCDRAIAVQTKSVRKSVPYTRSIAHDAGWQWRIPLQHRMGNGIVYCSRFMEQDDALKLLFDTVEGERLVEPNFIRFKTGAREKQWEKNCIAVGLSSGFMEPLESTSIHMIQRNVLRLVRLMPQHGINPANIDEFNKESSLDMHQIRDFLILHYHVTERKSDFWQMCRDMAIPDSLRHKIDLFTQSGRVFRRSDELFAENSWIQVMIGQGLMPESWHPIVGKMNDKQLAGFLTKVHDHAKQVADSLPEHAAYVQNYCGTKG
ncbi:tryptophan halogenase family protein [Sphingomicrobium nitratireducens]|uniref:tryptophan halogenase family protein n=1 Tax=Sphingomicrobium nitratireducens TaxID=2964666 RepID=UPI00223EAD86|nr:tryptophan halogenase family protein [Sphingomicrobium nitratireducens]